MEEKEERLKQVSLSPYWVAPESTPAPITLLHATCLSAQALLNNQKLENAGNVPRPLRAPS